MSFSSQQKFETLGQPFHWWCTADSMKDAAELVFAAIEPARIKPTEQELDLARQGYELAHPSHDRRSVYVLLVGFCLENLLKAEYMRLNDPNLTDGKLPNELKNHDLIALSKLVGFAPTSEEHQMLGVASDATVSWGRYPGGFKHDRGGMSPPECLDLDHFRRAFEAVYWRLTEVITDGWED